MGLIFITGPDDTGPIMELVAKSPTLKNFSLVHLSPQTAAKQLSDATQKKGAVVATIGLVQKTDQMMRFPYTPAFFSKFHPDAFIILEADGDDRLLQRVVLHLALSASPDSAKVIKVDRGNIKQAIVDARRALAEVSG